eukprot:3370895-Alexandrium_andersonii.AAC.1
MSASLVGSEMCIRDSLFAIWAGFGYPAMVDTAHMDDKVDAVCQAGADAVSYTHLTLPTICSV